MALQMPTMPAPTALLYAGLVVVALLCGLSDAASGKAVDKRKREAKGVYDYGGTGDLSKVEVEMDMTVEDYGEPQKLRCHNCYLSVHGLNCMTLEDFSNVDVQECMADEPWCTVESLYTDDELTTFTRKCSQECAPGCQTAGDTYKLETCASCCKEDFCNTDSGGAFAPSSSSVLLLLLISALTLLLARGL